jgi:hypothetical protein
VKHAVQRGILGTNSAFGLGPRKTTENLHRIGRSHDLPDAKLLLASSPALNTRTLTSLHVCAVSLFDKIYLFVFTDVSFYAHTLDEAICNSVNNVNLLFGSFFSRLLCKLTTPLKNEIAPNNI